MSIHKIQGIICQSWAVQPNGEALGEYLPDQHWKGIQKRRLEQMSEEELCRQSPSVEAPLFQIENGAVRYIGQ